MTTKASLAANNASRGAGLLAGLYDLIGVDPARAGLLEDAIASVSGWMDAMRRDIGTEADRMATERVYGPGVKAWGQELKAEPLDDLPRLERWLEGKVPRRILMIPFGGPLPGGKAGLDLDGEYFDEETDLYGPFPLLRSSRDRVVDWHHDLDPKGVMKGAILGRVVMDERPESDGLWADFWANAGEKRRSLIAALERRGVPLYGSSQAIPTAVRKAADGHLDVWPVYRHTITTSPQNTLAVVPALKALLTGGLPSDATSKASLEVALLGMDGTPSRSTAPAGSDPIAAGLAPETLDKLETALDAVADLVAGLRS